MKTAGFIFGIVGYTLLSTVDYRITLGVMFVMLSNAFIEQQKD